MKTLYLFRGFAAASILALCAAGAASAQSYHTAVKTQADAIFISPTIGLGAGHLSVTVDKSANVDKNGKAITVVGGCKENSPDTYSNMNSKASAQASSVSSPTAAAAAAGGLAAPQIALATGDVTANGGAAIIASAAQTAHPADTIAAYCQNASLPSAAPGQIVRDGVAPAAGAVTP